jgi:hypothetical protein
MEIKDGCLDPEKVLDAWPDSLTYQGENLFSIYMKNMGKLEWLAGIFNESDGQEVYLGYSPEKDVFISGFDLHNESSSIFIEFKLIKTMGENFFLVKYVHMKSFNVDFYDESKFSGYFIVQSLFNDIVDIRLD